MALPIVLLLVLVAGVVISMMMDRHVAQALTVQRELQQYAFHHASKGVQEAVEAWLRLSGAGRNMNDAIELDGHAFDMTLDDGSMVRVSLFDAQGGVLVEMAGLSQEARELGRAMVGELQDAAGPEAARFIRREGPLPVSVNAAPPEVLAAAVSAAADGENVQSIVDEILHARESEAISQESLNEVLTKANAPPEIRPRLGLVLTAQPSLWRVVAEVQGSRAAYSGRSGRRFCGLVVLSGNLSGNSKDRATALQRNSMITSWEDCTEQSTP
ncbi:MAG: hypothetical protein WCK33_11605 [Phycisphaerae bacterium]|jgi:hypothetical protein